jgi:hypothetical protein
MLSEEAITRESQTYWLTMAEFWFRLAQHVEDTEAISVVDPSAVPEILADQEGEASTENPVVSVNGTSQSRNVLIFKTGH